MTATNEKLSESEIRYNYLIDSIPNVIGELGLDGTISFVSPQVYDLLGYYPDEMVGINFIKFIHPDDVPGIRKAMKKAVKLKEVSLPSLKLKHKKGNYIVVFAKGKLLKLDDKARLIGIIRDVTKLNETEKKLEESQDIFKQLNEVFLKFKEDPILNLQLLINTAGLLLKADCALFNILKRVNGKDVLESLVTYNEPPNFNRESDPKGHICTDIIKDNPDDVVIISNLDKTGYKKTDENVRKYDLKQYVSFVVRFNNKPTATFCVVYTENREMSNNDIKILKILSKSASTELARWNALRSLQESEEELLLERDNLINILNSMEDGVYIVDQNYDIEYVNPILIKEFGRYEGKKCYKYFHDRGKVCLWCKNQEVFKGKTVRWEWYSAKNQKIYDLIDTPLNNVDGSISKLEIFRDITKRKQLELDLKSKQAELESIFRAAPTGIGVVVNRIFKRVNDKFCELVGYPREELLNESARMVYPTDEDYELVGKEKYAQIENSGRGTVETRFKRKDGKIINILLSSALIDSDQLSAGVTFTALDITARKRTEQNLTESEEKYRYFFDNAQIGLFWSSITDGKFLECNETFAKLVGYNTREECLADYIAIEHYINLKDRDEMLKNINMNGDVKNYEMLLSKRDGTPFWASISARINLKENRIEGAATDITEHKNIEGKLKESEEKYRSLANELEVILDHIPGIVVYKDTENNILRVNKFLADASNLKKVEMENCSLFDLYPRDIAQAYWEDDLEVINSKKPKISIVEPWETEAGRRWVNTSKIPYIDENGNVKGIIAIAFDITERRIAEQNLKESEEKYLHLFMSSPYSIIIGDMEGNIIDCNFKEDKITGFTKEDIIGKNMLEVSLFPTEYLPMVMKDLKTLLKGNIPKTNELQIKKKDNSHIWVQPTASIFKLKNEMYLQIIMQDINDRKIYEEKLKESEERYRSLVEDAQEGVWALDENENTTLVNPRLCEMLGYTKNEMMGKNLDLFIPDSMKKRIKGNRIRREKGIKETYDLELVKKDGTIIYTKIKAAPIMSESRDYKGSFAYITDITEKKEIEEMKTYLLTRFSHEFKTPLVSIKGFSDLLLSEYKNKLDEKMIRFLEKIKEGGDKLKTLVNTFIQSSQLGENLTRLKIDKENLSDLIKLGVSEMQGLIHLRKHTINMDIPEKVIGEFDKEQIYSVITNLLLNAIKYTPPGGKIFIHSKIKEGDIFFSINDNGIGLTEEDKRHLFKSFGKIERYGNGWDIVTEGMGVGLYLSKEMISLHGGKIWAESEGKNKGSTFYFSLPMANN